MQQSQNKSTRMGLYSDKDPYRSFEEAVIDYAVSKCIKYANTLCLKDTLLGEEVFYIQASNPNYDSIIKWCTNDVELQLMDGMNEAKYILSSLENLHAELKLGKFDSIVIYTGERKLISLIVLPDNVLSGRTPNSGKSAYINVNEFKTRLAQTKRFEITYGHAIMAILCVPAILSLTMFGMRVIKSLVKFNA